MKDNQHNHTRTFPYLIQVQAVLYAVISATQFRGSTPFEIALGITVSNATHTPIRENTIGIDLAMYGEAHGVSIP